MSIDPTAAGGTNAFDAARAAQQNASVRAAKDSTADGESARKAAAAGDQVQLSPESRGLVQRAVAPAPVDAAAATGLTAEKLKLVLERIENGFYDRAEVRDGIARGIARDLGPE